MHEFKVFVDHSLEESPVSSEESWVLSDHVHDVTGYDSFVILASLLLTQTQQIFDDCHKESFLIFFMHSTTKRQNVVRCYLWIIITPNNRKSSGDELVIMGKTTCFPTTKIDISIHLFRDLHSCK